MPNQTSSCLRTTTTESFGDARCTDLAQLWRGLRAGEIALVKVSYVDSRCFAVLEERAVPNRFSPSALACLERVLSGDARKVVAIDSNVHESTVSQHCASVLRGMGQPTQPHQIPILLVMAVYAARGLPLPPARLEGVCPRAARWVISVELPVGTFRSRLSNAEWEVARMLVASYSYAQISRLRGTAVSTVANQLAGAFRKLGISGKAELRTRAVHEFADAFLRAREACS